MEDTNIRVNRLKRVYYGMDYNREIFAAYSDEMTNALEWAIETILNIGSDPNYYGYTSGNSAGKAIEEVTEHLKDYFEAAHNYSLNNPETDDE